ncbi:hypothetical protein HK100_010682, partial [Physocladia obscura]
MTIRTSSRSRRRLLSTWTCANPSTLNASSTPNSHFTSVRVPAQSSSSSSSWAPPPFVPVADSAQHSGFTFFARTCQQPQQNLSLECVSLEPLVAIPSVCGRCYGSAPCAELLSIERDMHLSDRDCGKRRRVIKDNEEDDNYNNPNVDNFVFE